MFNINHLKKTQLEYNKKCMSGSLGRGISISMHEISRIKDLSAFNIDCVSRQKLNQYLTIYTFGDNSSLWINHYRGMAKAYNPAGNLVQDETKLKINARGK